MEMWNGPLGDSLHTLTVFTGSRDPNGNWHGRLKRHIRLTIVAMEMWDLVLLRRTLAFAVNSHMKLAIVAMETWD
eukprot:3769372-Lingulodinium_polyedra.AAC.1